jgi:hypothetical protein
MIDPAYFSFFPFIISLAEFALFLDVFRHDILGKVAK